jgi:septal ring factor EnvC (AmiA/AmiB activator)
MASSITRFTSTNSSQGSSRHEYHESSSSSGGLLSVADNSESSASKGQPEHFTKSHEDLEKAQLALKQREAQLDEREAALKEQQQDLAERENALDEAHERLIGAEEDDRKPADNSSSIIDELRKENERLRAELAASKQKSGRFLSQRAEGEDASGRDRFRLSEKKSTTGGGLSTGFDPQMMERWRVGHQKMIPRMPRLASSRSDKEC